LRTALPIALNITDRAEHNLAKVGVEGSNPFARSKKQLGHKALH
jgi:hypothetical protein